MSKRMRASGPAVHNRRKPSRKGTPQHFLGGVVVTGLVLGCAWTVYTNVLGANVYPSVNSAAFEAPVVRNPTVVAAHPPSPTFVDLGAASTGYDAVETLVQRGVAASYFTCGAGPQSCPASNATRAFVTPLIALLMGL